MKKKQVLIRLIMIIGVATGALRAENTTFTSTHFSGSGNCTRCHNGMSDPSGNDMSIETAWSSTMMANAAKDPFWMAKVRSEITRNSHLESVINDKCTKCHAPMANKEAHYAGDEVKIFDGGFLDTANAHHDEALNGVSCTLCHQIKDNGTLGTLAGMSGNYEVDESRTIYGPYSDVATGPMINNVDYTIQYSDHVKQSKLCATCHNLKTPYVDEEGNVLSTTAESEFPEQMPYSEWEHSEYAASKSCQDCHMKRVDGVRIAVRPPWASTLRDGFAQHMFVGGNKTLLDILSNNKTALDVTGDNFATTIAKSDEMLKSAASIEVTDQSLQDGILEVSLKINSTTGHKLPTSFPSRRAFIHFVVRDASGNTVFESGKANADGSIVGVDADADGRAYEPHYEVITTADQVQVYEAIMQNNLGEVTYTLLRGMGYLKDNRILPSGFDKTTAAADIQVHGAALEDDNFVGGSDTITYRISGLGESGYTVDAALLYQTISHAFANDLFTDSSSEATAFQAMFNASSMKTSQIASVTFDIGASSGGSTTTACSDGLDNDGDGLIDLADAGCSDASDDDEADTVTTTACSDGIDNDGDGLVDLNDPGCSDAEDDDESNLVNAEPTVIFSDGFESGMDAWSVTGEGNTWYAHTENPYEGSYSAYVKRTGVGSPTYMETGFDASGYMTVTFSYSRRLKGLDAADDFAAEYYDGGSWVAVEHLDSGSENGGYVEKSYTIPSSATKIRFMCENGANGERCYVDNVTLTAE